MFLFCRREFPYALVSVCLLEQLWVKSAYLVNLLHFLRPNIAQKPRIVFVCFIYVSLKSAFHIIEASAFFLWSTCESTLLPVESASFFLSKPPSAIKHFQPLLKQLLVLERSISVLCQEDNAHSFFQECPLFLKVWKESWSELFVYSLLWKLFLWWHIRKCCFTVWRVITPQGKNR